MNTIVFLDIDGVLNNLARCQWIHENVAPGRGFGAPWELDDGNFTIETVAWDPANVQALWHILNETGSQIVISSTWRIGRRVPFFRECFVPFGEIPPIVGLTPVLRNLGAIRGDEVNAWLEQSPETERWVCLDDDGDFHELNNLVQTDIDFGLTMEDAERAIDFLTW